MLSFWTWLFTREPTRKVESTKFSWEKEISTSIDAIVKHEEMQLKQLLAQPKFLWQIKAFPKHYQNHIDHDIILARMTRGELDYMLARPGDWYFKNQDGFDAKFINANYRSFIIEKVDENDRDRSVQHIDPPATGETKDPGRDTGDRRCVDKSRSRKRPRKSDADEAQRGDRGRQESASQTGEDLS
jgi:hypothetical protein